MQWVLYYYNKNLGSKMYNRRFTTESLAFQAWDGMLEDANLIPHSLVKETIVRIGQL